MVLDVQSWTHRFTQMRLKKQNLGFSFQDLTALFREAPR